MKRSLQEYVELVVFGLIALLVGTGLLWLLGWVLSLGGVVLKGLAGLLWMLLRFVVPIAIAGGLVYFLVKAAQDKQKPAAAATSGSGTASVPAATAGAAATTAQDTATTSSAAQAVSADGDANAAADSDTVREVAAAGDSADLADEPALADDGAASQDDEHDAAG